MEQALRLAAHGVRGANPLVGAVVLDRNGEVLGTGFHRGAGTPHAEPEALADAQAKSQDLAGCTLVVTLEPCNHTGRTPACTLAIERAGIGRVVFAAADPNPQAAGGAAWLNARGIDTVGGLKQAVAAELNSRWLLATTARRPFVTLKTAQSLDSRVAAADGSSQWITGPEARADGHTIRRRTDAVLVGTGTVLADNPRLTAREPDGSDSPVQPLRIVLGERGIPVDAAIRGSGFLQLLTRNVPEALEELQQRSVGHLMIEGGPRIAGAFLAADLVDELFIYQAPVLLGVGQQAFVPLGIQTLSDAGRWELDDCGGQSLTRLGSDFRIHLKPATREGTPECSQG